MSLSPLLALFQAYGLNIFPY